MGPGRGTTHNSPSNYLEGELHFIVLGALFRLGLVDAFLVL